MNQKTTDNKTYSLLNKNKGNEKDVAKEIIVLLQTILNVNKTRTMTFTEDGLELAIKTIKEKYNV